MDRMLTAVMLLCVLVANVPAKDELAKNFANPPASARPWVFWFPLSGNLTKEGITADLEAMARVGVGGVLYMEVDQGAPKGKADFAGPLWMELFKHACNEGKRLGLEINMNNDAGWCGSGGPWITPELSMQKVVWSDTFVEGGRKFEGVLPQPQAVKDFYRDITVLAFPTEAGDETKMADYKPKFTSSGKNPKPGHFTLERPEPKEPQFVQVEFAEPYTARLLTANVGGVSSVQGALHISDDGRNFKEVKPFSVRPSALVMKFEQPVKARFFRLVFTKIDAKAKNCTVNGIDLSVCYRIENIRAKASFVMGSIPPAKAEWQALSMDHIIQGDRVMDLSSKMDSTGKLVWEPPAGRWTVVRFGHTTTGKENHPAPESGRGLECDKLSKEGAAAMFNGLMRRLIADNKAVSGQGKTLVATHIDSWEVGSQNWTPRIREEFLKRRGYDLWKYLPVFTGRVVDSLEASERFLWDLRQTVSDLLVENYAGEFRRLANKHGLRLSLEAYGEPADDMAYAGQADEPMAEFWSWGKFGAANSCTEMASAAHTYGKKILGAEAFTARDSEKWQGHPANVKDLGDWAFCEGVNRFVFHRYAAQPWTNVAPGMSMGPWGLHYERTQTWWEQSKAWHEYLARCQYLLQQGLFVADVAYLQHEGAPRRFTPPAGAEIAPHIRGGYNFDGCTPEVVLKRMSVKKGRIILPDGMSYSVLVVPDVETMTPNLLRRISQLADKGATVIAGRQPPQKSPSLEDMGKGDAEVKKMAEALWNSGKIITGKTAAEVLGERGVKPDFSAKPTLRYIHRVIGDADVYFVANPEQRGIEAVASFRIVGKRPEFWRPDTGEIVPVLAFEQHDGVTSVPLRFEASGSVFVVFRKAAVASEKIVSVTRDGKELLPAPTVAATTQPAGVSNTFTMAVWVNPEADTELATMSSFGTGALSVSRNDVLYPPPGHEVWTEADAGAGIAVGRNGVCVCEHGARHFPAVLVCEATITNWTHVAVVYRYGKPSLYINGKPAQTGLKSSFIVHGGVGVTHTRDVPQFKGSLTGLQQFDHALSENEIAKLAQADMPAENREEVAALDISRGEIRQSGAYVLKTADGQKRELNVTLPAPQEISGSWEVQFDSRMGGPAKAVTFEKLDDWSKRAEKEISYYSGTAVYRKDFVLAEMPNLEFRMQNKDAASDKSSFGTEHSKFILDLGDVAVMAEVKLNGKDLGILWKPPFRVDITDAVKTGQNKLEVKVVNLWINRQIGDQQLPEDSERNVNGTLKAWPQWLLDGKSNPSGRIGFSSWQLWKKDDPLVKSGLLGPVKVQTVARIMMK